MPFYFGRRSKVHPVEGGRREQRYCPECERNTTFVEAKKKSKYTAYFVIELFGTEDDCFMCTACGEAMDLEDTGAPRLSAEDEARALKQKADEAAKALKAREKERKQQEREVDRELADLKKRMRK